MNVLRAAVGPGQVVDVLVPRVRSIPPHEPIEPEELMVDPPAPSRARQMSSSGLGARDASCRGLARFTNQTHLQAHLSSSGGHPASEATCDPMGFDPEYPKRRRPAHGPPREQIAAVLYCSRRKGVPAERVGTKPVWMMQSDGHTLALR